MTQTSYPIKAVKFSTSQWRTIFGGISGGIAQDYFGDAYALVRGAGDSSVVTVMGSDAVGLVAGFAHSIPVIAGVKSSEPLTIPAPINQPRTDIIVLRFNPGNEAAAGGPISLAVVTGTEGNPPNTPLVDDAPPGLQDIRLWSITRTPGSTLATAPITDLRSWVGRHIQASAATNVLTLNEPIGTTVSTPAMDYRRVLIDGTVLWDQINKGQGWNFRRLATDSAPAGAWGFAAGGIVTNAPAGTYHIAASTAYRPLAQSVAYHRVMAQSGGGASYDLSRDMVVPNSPDYHVAPFAANYAHPGGDLDVRAYIMCQASTVEFRGLGNGGSIVSVHYVGPGTQPLAY